MEVGGCGEIRVIRRAAVDARPGPSISLRTSCRRGLPTGGIIFFLLPLRTVLEQYEPASGNSAIAKPVPSVFEMAIPMIISLMVWLP
jgi:hypothetical protein